MKKASLLAKGKATNSKHSKQQRGKLRASLAAKFNAHFEAKCAEAVGRGGRPLDLLKKEASKAGTIVAIKPHTKGRKPLKRKK